MTRFGNKQFYSPWFDPTAEKIVKPLYPMRNITLLDHTIVSVNHKFKCS